jgi:5-methylcytosine-specific restriction endonuclease McrA
MKQCTKCDEVKPLSEFHKNHTTKDGHRNMCKVCAIEARRSWSAKNPDYYKDYDKNRNQSAERKAYKAECQKDYYERKPHIFRANSAKRRALLFGATVGTLPANFRELLIEFYGNACMFPGCDKPINEKNKLTVDHVVPLARGGAHSLENMQLLCQYHNSSKHARSTADYRNGIVLENT